jgi:hypothetical protein
MAHGHLLEHGNFIANLEAMSKMTSVVILFKYAALFLFAQGSRCERTHPGKHGVKL